MGRSKINAKIIMPIHPVIKMRESLVKTPCLLDLDSTIFPNEEIYSMPMQESIESDLEMRGRKAEIQCLNIRSKRCNEVKAKDVKRSQSKAMDPKKRKYAHETHSSVI